MTKKQLLLEEYKILEGRHHNDTNRIWSQAQTLIAANFVALAILGSLYSSLGMRLWLFSSAFIFLGIAIIGLVVCITWFFSISTDSKYQGVTRSFLIKMEEEIQLPFKAFTKAEKERKKVQGLAKYWGTQSSSWVMFVFQPRMVDCADIWFIHSLRQHTH